MRCFSKGDSDVPFLPRRPAACYSFDTMCIDSCFFSIRVTISRTACQGTEQRGDEMDAVPFEGWFGGGIPSFSACRVLLTLHVVYSR